MRIDAILFFCLWIDLYNEILKHRVMSKRGNSQQAQVSMEYLMVVAFVFIMVIPFIIYFFTESNSTTSQIDTAQLSQIARKIAENAEKVYAFGSPTTLTLRVYLPSGVESVYINGTTIGFIVVVGEGNSNVYETTSMNVSGSFGVGEGIHRIRIEAAENSVIISEVT
jgi:uncharacterized protein (UPF0333 family)